MLLEVTDMQVMQRADSSDYQENHFDCKGPPMENLK